MTTSTAAGAALTNYNVTFVPGTFIITRMTATVTAGNGAKVFGTPDGPITASASGFLVSDGITVSATRAAGENVGSYVTRTNTFLRAWHLHHHASGIEVNSELPGERDLHRLATHAMHGELCNGRWAERSAGRDLHEQHGRRHGHSNGNLCG